jgi:hypothetical protein
VENGTLTYIDSKKKKELGIYETYFIEKKTTLEEIVSNTLKLAKERNSEHVGDSEIVILSDVDTESKTLALISTN